MAGISLLLALSTSACTASRAELDDDDDDAPSVQRVDERGRVVISAHERSALGLEVKAVTEGALQTSSLRFGRVVGRPQEDALVAAPVAGRLIMPALSLGAAVKRDDVIAQLEPLVDTASRASFEAQRRELEGQIEAARADISAKEGDLARASSLAASGLATNADSAHAQAELTAQRARVESLRRASAELQHRAGGRLQLRAPASGVLAMLATDTGSMVQPGTVLARIVSAGPRWIDVAVSPEEPVGSAYRVQWGASSTAATLLSKGAVVQDDGTRRDRLEASSDVASADLLTGATVRVEVLRDARGVLVPVQAVVRGQRTRLVFVEVKAGLYESRSVELGARDEATAIALSGLRPGERIVTRGAAALLGELEATGGAKPSDDSP